MSVFADHARKLFELNLSIVPVDGETKACYHEGWGKFANELPTEEQFDKWEITNAKDGIGLICGKASNIIAIDFDYVGPDAALIENIILGILPPSPIAKKGGKGWTKFYKWSELTCPKAINKDIGTKIVRVIDVLDNRLTVLPPTPHKNGNDYVWLTEFTLEHINEVDLHYINDDMINAINEICQSTKDELIKPKEGRHDKLFGYHLIACRIAKNFNEYKKLLWEKDIEFHSNHPKGPHFQDPKSFKSSGSSEKFLDKEANRWIKSYAKYLRVKKGIEFFFVDDLPEDVDIDNEKYFANKYKHYMCGFHYEYFDENDKVKKAIDYLGFSKFIHEKYNLIINEAYTYIYKDGYYQELVDKNMVDKLVIKYTKEKVSPRNISAFVKMLKAIDPKFISQTPHGFINLSNGVYDVKNNKLLPHSPEWHFIYKLDIEYTENTSCPKWLNFLNQILLGDAELISVSQEMFGYVLLGGNPFLHKAFILSGDGRNGKSTMLDVLKKLIGKENYSSVPVNLLEKPFSAIQLNGKLANIVGELSTSTVDSEYFKTAVGGEPLNMARKGKDEFSKPIEARLVFATNKMPSFKDTSVGIYEKLCIIPFDYYIPENDRNPFINEELFLELSGIFKWAIEGANRVLTAKKLTDSLKIRKAVNMWREDMDPVYRFVDEKIKITKNQRDAKHNAVVYMVYENFCKESNLKPIAKPWFMRRLYDVLRKKSDDLSKIEPFESNGNSFVPFIELDDTTKIVVRQSIYDVSSSSGVQ